MLHLTLANRSPAARSDSRNNHTRDERRNLIPQLRQLSEELARILQSGQTAQARALTRQLLMPPIAWGFLAACLQKNNISDETIEGLLS